MQLTNHLTSNHLTHKFQPAYCTRHSTERALLHIISDILTTSDANQVSILTLLDLSAAFDIVDHTILFSRLEQHFCVSTLALSWFKSYLSNRFQFVSASGSNSKWPNVDYGVPQGSMLRLILFVLYTQSPSQILFNYPRPHQFFADDTQLRKSWSPELYGDTRDALQTCISDIKENKLQLTADKTGTMLLNSSKFKHPPVPLSICQATILLLQLSQEPWFLPRQGYLYGRTHQFHLQNCFSGNPTY